MTNLFEQDQKSFCGNFGSLLVFLRHRLAVQLEATTKEYLGGGHWFLGHNYKSLP